MDIFIELKKYLSFLGIKPDKKSTCSAENLTIVILLSFCFISMSLYIVFESESLISSGSTFYATVSTALNIVTLSSIILKESKIFKLLKGFKEMIMNRKFLSTSRLLLDF